MFSLTDRWEQRKIKDGDLIGIALDMDNKVLYWHVNGEWISGRPGSGLGEPLLNESEDYFIAVSVQSEGEAWAVNFGGKPFKFQPPSGFSAYGGPVSRFEKDSFMHHSSISPCYRRN